MRKLWKRFIQSLFGEPYSLQGQWLGWENCELDCGYDQYCNNCTFICDDLDCELCAACDTFGK